MNSSRFNHECLASDTALREVTWIIKFEKGKLTMMTIQQIVERQLCCGCGVCMSAAPNAIRIVDDLDLGRRPVVDNFAGLAAVDLVALDLAAKVCPGAQLEHIYDPHDAGLIDSLTPGWGPIYGIFEGFAADSEIRFAGSSGGVATALSLHGILNGGMHGVLHTKGSEKVPYLNTTTLSTTREELLNAAGSRYAPASPADSLQLIENAPSACVFVGKPCDVAGVQALRQHRPELDEKLGITIAFFCAGVPSTRGTLKLLDSLGVEDPQLLHELRYRGRGWPGHFVARWPDAKDNIEKEQKLTYQSSWGKLQKYRQWRCYVCADHTGEFADISVGDPWYREQAPDDPGRSMILARTQRGLEYLKQAQLAGHIVMEEIAPNCLEQAQQNLLTTRGSLWVRLKVLRLLGAAAPKFRGFAFARFWWQLPFGEKLHSFYGTAKRVFSKGLRKKIRVAEFDSSASGTSTKEME